MPIGVNILDEYNLNFHQTFKPEKLHLSSLLELPNGKYSINEISHSCGIPTGKSSGKVDVTLHYLKAASLINYEAKNGIYEIQKTLMGDFIADEDPFLENYETKLYFHYMYTYINTLLIMWRQLFIEFQSFTLSNTFNREDLLDFYKKSNTQKIHTINPILGTYTNKDSLIDINILQIVDRNSFKFNECPIIEQYSKWFLLFLTHTLRQIDKDRESFLLKELSETKFEFVFCWWEPTDLAKLVLLLEEQNLIYLNKQLDEIHIYLKYSLSEVVKMVITS